MCISDCSSDVGSSDLAVSSETLEGMLKSQYLDFAVLTMVEDDPEIDSSPVAHDAAYLFGPKGCGLAELKEISMADLSERPTLRQYNATVVAKRTETGNASCRGRVCRYV